jgi:electron transfer flavoprotein alpha subunit
MSSVFLLAEHNAGRVAADTLAAISAAAQIGEVTALVMGSGADEAAHELASLNGVARILMANGEALTPELPESVAPFIVELCRTRGFTHLVSPASSFGKMVLPRAAALLDAGQVSDVIRIEDEATFVRPMYAGNVLVRVRCLDPVRVLTIRASAYPAATSRTDSTRASIEPISGGAASARSRFVERQINSQERPQLVGARVIVSGGRGMGSAANFKLLDPIAAQLGAAVGASRAAVDAGFVPNDYQVGQTGKIVAPDLYIAFGISGAIQHLAGMKDSKVIVAVNKDPEAPIFSIADYGLVADLFEVLPQIEEGLGQYTQTTT